MSAELGGGGLGGNRTLPGIKRGTVLGITEEGVSFGSSVAEPPHSRECSYMNLLRAGDVKGRGGKEWKP